MPLSATVDSFKDYPIAQIRHHYEILKGHLKENGTPFTEVTPLVLALVLDGWRKFISPYTRHTDLSDSPCDSLLRYVSLLLSSMNIAVQEADRQQVENASSQIACMWPSIWIWLQTLHSQRSHSPPDDDSISPTYLDNVVKMFLLTSHVDPPTRLSVLIMGEKGAKEMMVSAWIEEGSDISAAHGFCTSALTEPFAFGSSSNFIQHIVDFCEGGVNDVVKILFCRIKYNVKQAKTDWGSLLHDIEVIKNQIYPCKDEKSQILRQALLFHPEFTSAMVDLLSQLLNKSPQPTVDLKTYISYPLLIIGEHLDIRGYNCVVQLMNTTFIALIARVPRTHVGDQIIGPIVEGIFKRLARFVVYRGLLRNVGRNIDLALVGREAAYRTGGGQNRTGKLILALKDQYVRWAHLYNDDYRMFASKHKTDCGYPLCGKTDGNHIFRRCSGCKFVQYCSKSCQREHWRGKGHHRILCAEMSSSGGEPVGLSGPGLRFITHVVAHDCMGLDPKQRHVFEQGSPIKFAIPARKFILMVNYANAPGQDRVWVETIHLPHFDETSAAANLSDTGVKLTDAWYAAWAQTHLGLSEHLRCVVPIFVVLPRKLDGAQVMTAFFTLHRRPGQSQDEPHIRWLHRM